MGRVIAALTSRTASSSDAAMIADLQEFWPIFGKIDTAQCFEKCRGRGRGTMAAMRRLLGPAARAAAVAAAPRAALPTSARVGRVVVGVWAHPYDAAPVHGIAFFCGLPLIGFFLSHSLFCVASLTSPQDCTLTNKCGSRCAWRRPWDGWQRG